MRRLASAQEVPLDCHGQFLRQARPGQGARGLKVRAVHYAVRAHRVDEPEGEVQRLLRVGVPDVADYRFQKPPERRSISR